jgi:hypothetical protein
MGRLRISCGLEEELAAAGQDRFHGARSLADFTFRRDPAGKVRQLDIVAATGTTTLDRTCAPSVPVRHDPLAGRFYSPELTTTFEITANNDGLLLRRPKALEVLMTPVNDALFLAGELWVRPVFDAERCIAINVSHARARKITFHRFETRDLR